MNSIQTCMDSNLSFSQGIEHGFSCQNRILRSLDFSVIETSRTGSLAGALKNGSDWCSVTHITLQTPSRDLMSAVFELDGASCPPDVGLGQVIV
jgi:hypothetical protein